MATTRPFAYNTGSTIDGTTQIGNIAIGVSDQDYSQDPGGVKWWMGPDEELGYVIANQVPTGDHPTPVDEDSYINFWRSTDLTEQSLLDLLNVLPITDGLEPFINATDAKDWLENNGYFTTYGESLSTPTPTNLPTATPTPTPTDTPTPTPVPTDTPTPEPTATEVPPTETPTPTPTPTYYYYYLLNCDLVTNAYGRSLDPDINLSGFTFNVDTNICYTIVGNDDGPYYDYDLDNATIVTDCTDVSCGLPTPTPTPNATNTPTSTPTPEMASLDIDIVMGYNGISFDGVTYTSDTTISVVKNQQYNIIAFNGSGLFQNWEGTNVNLPVPNSSNTIVTVTGNTATLKAVFPEMTPTPNETPIPATSTPTPTPEATSTPEPATATPAPTGVPTDTPTPEPTATEVPPTETPTPTVEPTATPTPNLTDTPTPTPTATEVPPTATPTPDPTPTPEPTATEVLATSTPTPTPTSTTEPNTFNVTNDGSSNYLINGQSDPTLTLTEGQTYTFNVNATGHPFWIKTAQTTGTGNQYNDGVTNNGVEVGTITFVVPYNAPSTLYYICQYHGSMVGTINIIDVPQ